MGETVPGVAGVDIHVFVAPGIVACVCQVVVRLDDLARPLEFCFFNEWEMRACPGDEVVVVFAVACGGFLSDFVVFAADDYVFVFRVGVVGFLDVDVGVAVVVD